MTTLPRVKADGGQSPDKEKANPIAAPGGPSQAYREGLSVEHRVAILNKEAKTMMSTGNYHGAVQICTEAISLNNSNLAIISRAYCYKYLKMWSDAISDFSSAIAQDTTNPASVYAQRGICYGKLEIYGAAIEDLNKAILMEPTNSSLFNRGCIHADSGNLESAIADFDKIIFDPNQSDLKSRSIYHRSGAYIKLERYVDAIDDLRGLLRTDPNSLHPRLLLAKALKMTGEYAKAEESVSQARDLDPKQADIYIERGDIRCRMGLRKKIYEAIEDFDMALKILTNSDASSKSRSSIMTLLQSTGGNPTPGLGPEVPDTNGRSFAAKGRPGSQTKMVRSLSERGQHCANDEEHSGSSLVKMNSVPSGMSRSSTTAADNHSKRRAFSGSRRQKSSKNVLITEVNPASRRGKDVPYFGNMSVASVYGKRAQARLLVDDADDVATLKILNLALEDAEKAMEIIPGNVQFSIVRATCLIRLSRYEEAAMLLDVLLEANGENNSKALYHRAFCYRAQNVPMSAVECLTKIIVNFDLAEKGESREDVADVEFAVRVYELRGTLLHEQKAFKIAVTDFGKAISLRPFRSENYFFRGSCYSQLGKFDMALEDFEMARSTGFTNLPYLLMQQGTILRLMGRSRDAVETFNRAMEALNNTLSDDHDIAAQNDVVSARKELLWFRLAVYKALCLLDQGKYRKAKQVLHVIAEHMEKKKMHSLRVVTAPGPSLLDGNLQWILKYHIAMASHMMGEFAEAQELLTECVDKLRSFVPDGFALGSALFFLAIEKYMSCENEDPALADIMSACVEILTECFESPWTAISAHNKMLCFLSRGKAHQRLGEHELAIDDFTAAIEVILSNTELQQSEAAYSYFRRAWSYKALLKFDNAADDFETAKRMKTDDPNFSINYRSINHVQYIEIRTEPDTVAPFVPLVPLLANKVDIE